MPQPLKLWLVGACVLLGTLTPLVWAAIHEEVNVAIAVLVGDLIGVAGARIYFEKIAKPTTHSELPVSARRGGNAGRERGSSFNAQSWRPFIHAVGMAFGISTVLALGYLAYYFDL